MGGRDDVPDASAEQDHWQEICAAVRAGLAKMAALVPAMEPEEAASLCDAIDTAMWNETKARSFDQAVEERRRTLERQAEYGG